jgi:hypothetical protein
MSNFSEKPAPTKEEQLWQVGRLWSQMRSVRCPPRLLSGPRRRRALVYLALHLLYGESPSLWIDLRGLCYVARLDQQSEDAARKWLQKYPYDRLVERRPLEIHKKPNKSPAKQITLSKGLVCHDAMVLVDRHCRRLRGRRRFVYRINPLTLDFKQTSEGRDIINLPLLAYGDTEYLKHMNERHKDEFLELAESLIASKNRLNELLSECGILEKEVIHRIAPKAALRELESSAREFEEGKPEQRLKWQGLVSSREAALIPELYDPKCVKCGQRLSRLDLKYKGTASCPKCRAEYFGFRCRICLSPVVSEASAVEVPCQVCGTLYAKQEEKR